MTTYIQNHTLLGSLQDYNAALKALHAKCREGSSSELQKQLTGYMEQLQTYIGDLLETVKADLSAAEEETFNQYTLDTHPLEDLEANLPMPEAPLESIEWILHRQQYMAEWCEGIASQSISTRTTEVFGMIGEHLKELNRKFSMDTKAYSQESGQS